MKKSIAMGLTCLILAGPAFAAKKDADEKPAVRSKRMVEVCGFLKFTAAADTGVYPGNYAAWARSGFKDNQYNSTAKESRLGLNFLKEGEERQVSGKLEIDFFGSASENKANPMMRHAYLEIFCPKKNVSILAGQTWDVISPLNPMSNNYSVYWWAGNIGYRRPQLRFTKAGEKVTTQVAFTRTIGDIASSTAAYGSGEDGGFPTVQGRMALSGPRATLGIWGHFGEEEYGEGNFVSSSAGADLKIKMGEKAVLLSEAWMGKNLDAYLGGVGQGMNGSKEIHAQGGWAALILGPFQGTKVYFGGGFDNPNNLDVKTGMRSCNSAGWGGVSVDVVSGTALGLEYSYLDTRYLNAPMGYSHRGQMTLTYGI